MIERLVITSVERGLGSGPGLQPVLRTKGMRPAVAERLRLRSGYAHPYPFGDRRNPVVYFHRIETVAGQRLHVLARVGDAGSDYSGRSNRISDLLALDVAECQRRPGGPAAVAESFSWFQSWSDPPREVEPPIPLAAGGADEPSLRACATWAAATGDAGWAGELAKSFLDGRSAVVIARPVDDVLRLFAEAMQLLPLASRWNVTFTSCELEPSSTVWRAIRSDITRLPRGGDGRGLTIDVEAIGREKAAAPDHAYSRFARGAGLAPWVTEAPVAVQAGPRQPAAGSASIEAVQQTLTGESEFADVGATIRQRRESMRVSRGITRDQEASAHGAGHQIATIATFAVTLCLLVLGVAYIAWFQFDPQAATAIRSLWARTHVPTALGHTQEVVELEDKERRRVRLAREDEEKKAKAAWEKEAKEADAKQKDRNEKEKALAAAQDEKEKAALRREREQRDAQAAAERMKLQREALNTFDALPDRIALSQRDRRLDPTKDGLQMIDVGAYHVDHLIEPSFALAMPSLLVNGGTVSLAISAIGPFPTHAWRVTASIPKKYDLPSDNSEVKPESVCDLSVRDGRLYLVWDDSVRAEYPGVRLLRNSVLIASCLEPGTNLRRLHKIFLDKPAEAPTLRFASLEPEEERPLGTGGRLQGFEDGISWVVEVRYPWLINEIFLIRSPQVSHTAPRFPATEENLYDVVVDCVDKTNRLVQGRIPVFVEAEIQLSSARETAMYKLKPVIGDPSNGCPCRPNWLTEDYVATLIMPGKSIDSTEESLREKLEKNLSDEFRKAVIAEFLKDGHNVEQRLDSDKNTPERREARALALKNNIRNWDDFGEQRAKNDSDSRSIKVPGQNYPRPSGVGQETYHDTVKYNRECEDVNKRNGELKKIGEGFGLEIQSRLSFSARKSAESLAGLRKAIEGVVLVRVREVSIKATSAAGDAYPVLVVAPESTDGE